MNSKRLENGQYSRQYNQYDLSGEYGIGWTNKGEEFWFDIEDYNKIKDYCWHFNQWGHLISTEPHSNKRAFLHRKVMEPIPEGMVVNHKNHPPGRKNKFDNRKSNLEICTPQQNSMNHHIHSNNTTGHSGITYKDDRWIVRIGYMNNRIYLGSYKSLEEAINVRKKAEEKYYGQYSLNNNIGGN